MRESRDPGPPPYPAPAPPPPEGGNKVAEAINELARQVGRLADSFEDWIDQNA